MEKMKNKKPFNSIDAELDYYESLQNPIYNDFDTVETIASDLRGKFEALESWEDEYTTNRDAINDEKNRIIIVLDRADAIVCKIYKFLNENNKFNYCD